MAPLVLKVDSDMGKLALDKLLVMLLILGPLVSGCGSNRKKELSPLQEAFNQQLSLACEQEKALYQKEVEDLSNTDTPDEVRVDTLAPGANCPLQEELSFLLQQSFDDPTMREKYEEEKRGDTLYVKVLPSEQQSTELQYQKLVQNEEEKIQYLETYLLSNSWLYRTRINAWVKFDSNGVYHSHQIQSYMEVSTVKTPFHARITGKLQHYE